MTWQPIETAPKDYRRLLLYDAEASVVISGRWSAQMGFWIEDAPRALLWSETVGPTHWMPLMDLPEMPAA